MKVRNVLTSIAIALATFTPAFAQTPSAAHQNAHKLAHESRLDVNTLNTMVSNDVNAREAVNALSPQKATLIDDLLAEAKKYIGTPYVHGAKGPKAFDCSGYTSYIYKKFSTCFSTSRPTTLTSKLWNGSKIISETLSIRYLL